MNKSNYELIKYWDEFYEQYRYYWISFCGIITSPRFTSEEDANKYIEQTIRFFESRKKELVAK